MSNKETIIIDVMRINKGMILDKHTVESGRLQRWTMKFPSIVQASRARGALDVVIASVVQNYNKIVVWF